MRESNGRFLFEGSGFNTPSVQAALAKAGFRASQPRDDCGRWTCDSGSPLLSLRAEHAQYRGYFHDFMVDHLIENLTSRGVKAIKNVPVLGINGVLAIPDGATLIPGRTIPYFIEVKTGFDPDFTSNQTKVYPLICAGGHAVSVDPRIRDLGLTPGKLLPPMDIMVARVYGPGLPIRAESFCAMYGFGRTSHAH